MEMQYFLILIEVFKLFYLLKLFKEIGLLKSLLNFI